MNKVTKGIFAIVLGVSLVAPAMAQQSGPRGGGGGGVQGGGQRGPGGQGGNRMMMGGRMKEIQTKVLAQLGLNDAQKSKIKALDADTDKKLKALMDANKGKSQNDASRKAMMEKFRAINDSRKTQFEKILTPAQLKKYESLMKAEMEKARKEREKNGGGRPGGGAKGGSGSGKP